jgi:hypothetical protein
MGALAHQFKLIRAFLLCDKCCIRFAFTHLLPVREIIICCLKLPLFSSIDA